MKKSVQFEHNQNKISNIKQENELETNCHSYLITNRIDNNFYSLLGSNQNFRFKLILQ